MVACGAGTWHSMTRHRVAYSVVPYPPVPDLILSCMDLSLLVVPYLPVSDLIFSVIDLFLLLEACTWWLVSVSCW